MGVINKLLGRLKLYSDPAVTTQTTTVIQSDTTNSNLALVPNGTGAIIASVPDGTTTGGNARGQYAVDLQLSRTANTQIASSTASSILGGINNTSSAPYTLTCGYQNTASSQGAIAMGYVNTATSNGNVSLGWGNNSTGFNSKAFAYYGNAIGNHSVVFGSQTKATADYSTANNYIALAYLYGQNAYSSGNFGPNEYSNFGYAQQSRLTARREVALSSASTMILSLDGTGTTNLIIPNGNNRAWNVQIDTIAVVTAITGTATGVSVGDCYRETKQLLFKRIGGTSSIVGTVDTTSIKSDTSMSACAMTITAGASQEMALTFTAPTFTGGGSVTVRVVSKVSLVEVAY